MRSVVVGAVIGALFFGMAGGIEAALLGLVFGALVVAVRQIQTQDGRLDELGTKLRAQEQQLRMLALTIEAPLTGTPGEAPRFGEPTDLPTAAAQHAPFMDEPGARGVAPEPVPEPEPEPVAAGGGPDGAWFDAPASPPGEPQPGPLEPVFAAVRGYLTGGNVVARVGVIVLFFGLAFLLKYAADQDILPIEVRLAGVALGGVALLAGGWRLRERAGYGLILQGAGVGTLYLTTFTALRLYALLPPMLAFGVLLALVMLSAALALLQDSRSLATLGSAGGFLAPILTSSGEGSHVVLFSYYALLNLGIVAIAWRRAWRGLNLLGFGFTLVIGALWGAGAYRMELYASTQPFLAFFFVLYVVVAVLFATRQPPRLKGYVDGALVFGVPVAAFSLQSALVAGIEFGLAFSALAIAAVYLGLATFLRRRGEAMRSLTEAFLALGVAFATLAVPFALDGRWTGVTWALEGAALLWVGVRQQRLLPRASGVLLQFAAGIAFLAAFSSSVPATPVLNPLYLGAVLIAGSALFSAFYLERHRERVRPGEHDVAVVMLSVGVIWWLGAGLHEIAQLLSRPHDLLAAMGFVALSSLALDRLAARLRWTTAGLFPIALLPALGVLALSTVDAQARTLILSGWGAPAWALALGVHLFLLRVREHDWPAAVVRFWHMGGLWLALGVLTVDLAWAVERTAGAETGWWFAAWAIVPALAVAALIVVRPAVWPLARHAAAYQGEGLVPLVVYLYLWSWIVCFASGDPAPLPYLPLVNPLELAQVAVLLVLVRWWLAMGHDRLPRSLPPAVGPVALGLVGFMLLNGMLARSVSTFAAVPYSAESLYRSIWFQSGLSILWSCLALAVMQIAGRRGVKPLWFVGGGLLVLVVLKLFLIELASSGTMARIVSFVAVGLLMLLIGYVAPMPPRREPGVGT
jgi:uncharacterized membrane protein